MIPVFSAALLTLVAATAGQSMKTALKLANELEQKAQTAAKAHDQQSRIDANRNLLELLNGSPEVIKALARAYTDSGDQSHAIEMIDLLADLGQDDRGLFAKTSDNLTALQASPAYKLAFAHLKANDKDISRSTKAFSLSDADLLPEDIDYDWESQSFLITSILKHKIVRVRMDGILTDFASAPDNWPMAAIKVDKARHRVWATEVAFDGLKLTPASAWGRSAVLRFDLQTGKLQQRIEGPPHSSLGDMVLSDDGEPIVSDGDKGIFYRVSNGQLIAINKTDFISPQTATRIASGKQLLVPDYLRGIGRLDLNTGQVSWLNRTGADKVALNGIDGLYSYGHYLIATQNGTSPQRVAPIELDSTQTHVKALSVIQQTASPPCDPTHGVIVGKKFYFITNSGWEKLDDQGNLKNGMKLTNPIVMSYTLP